MDHHEVENSFVASFNGTLRDEFLNEHLFLGVKDAQENLAEWRDEYNRYRPHSSLGNNTPEEIWRSFEDGLTQAVVSFQGAGHGERPSLSDVQRH